MPGSRWAVGSLSLMEGLDSAGAEVPAGSSVPGVSFDPPWFDTRSRIERSRTRARKREKMIFFVVDLTGLNAPSDTSKDCENGMTQTEDSQIRSGYVSVFLNFRSAGFVQITRGIHKLETIYHSVTLRIKESNNSQKSSIFLIFKFFQILAHAKNVQ